MPNTAPQLRKKKRRARCYSNTMLLIDLPADLLRHALLHCEFDDLRALLARSRQFAPLVDTTLRSSAWRAIRANDGAAMACVGERRRDGGVLLASSASLFNDLACTATVSSAVLQPIAVVRI